MPCYLNEKATGIIMDDLCKNAPCNAGIFEFIVKGLYNTPYAISSLNET